MKLQHFIFSTAFLALATLNSCQSGKTGTGSQVDAKPTSAWTIPELLEKAEANMGKEVVFQGRVDHVCSHSGQRVILVDSSGENTIRVEASGDLQGFNKELSGMLLEVTGIVQEKRLESEFIDEWEAETLAKADKEEGGKHCSSELANIRDMREWMAANNKDYYSIYYINGTNYDVKE